ncbi:MAG: hypothetical protein ACRDPY_15155 [Streptosporangiaceae bacterium]
MDAVVNAYEIKLAGCDANTSFAMELTDAEAELLQRVAALSKKTSEFNCMPTMTVHAVATGKADQ